MFPAAGLMTRTTPTQRRDIRVGSRAGSEARSTPAPSGDGAESALSGIPRPRTHAALNGSAHTRRAADAGSGTAGLPASGGEGLPTMPPGSTGRCGRALDATRWYEVTGPARWLVVLVLGFGLLALELAVFDDHVESELRTLRSAGRSASSPGATTPSLAAPTIPAPLAGDPVTSVDLRAMTRCEPATTCPSRLQVQVRPAPQPRRMAWTYQITDRCTGRTQRSPGGSITIDAGGTRATVVNEIPLPGGRALALNAVLEEPTRTASPTLLVPATAAC